MKTKWMRTILCIALLTAYSFSLGTVTANAVDSKVQHNVICVTPGVKLWEYTWYNDTIHGEVTTMLVDNSGFTPAFIVEIQRGYRESEEGIRVMYESSDQPLVEASRYDHDRTYYQVAGRHSTSHIGAFNGILSDTTIYVTGVEEDPDGDHFYDIWKDQGDGTHKASCIDDGCTHAIVREHTWDAGRKIKDPTCEAEGVYRYECTTRDCLAVKDEAIPIIHNLTEIPAKEATCSAAGTVAHWICADCKRPFADNQGAASIAFVDTCIPSVEHSDSCGHTVQTGKFIMDPYLGNSSSQDGTRCLIIGKVGDKLYAMGNVTNPDGSRNAVEVSVNEYGTVTASSDQAEFLTFSWPGNAPYTSAFLADGGILAMTEGHILSYDPSRYVSNTFVPEPGDFYPDGDDGAGDFRSYIRTTSDYAHMVFDADTLSFKVASAADQSVYLYAELCAHTSMIHVHKAEPTCTEQGTEEYWYCDDDDCWNYYQNNNFEVPVEFDYGSPAAYWTKPATGHSYSGGVCVNCGMKRPVYTQVSTLEQFDALSKDASYIIVVKDGSKTYAAALPKPNPYVWNDYNGNSIHDGLELDDNGNEIPDLIENYDGDGDGVMDYLQDQSGDGNIDSYDWELILSQLEMKYDEDAVSNPNFAEVSISSDGSITVTNELIMEFQMMVSGVWGSQGYFPEDFEHYDIKDYERIRAAWIPNYWIGYSGMMGYYSADHFMTARRVYGDYKTPGILDHKNWKISFCEDGTACLVNTWESFDDTGALQMVKYTDSEGNAQMTLFGTPEWLWTYSEIAKNATEWLPAYLYASEAVNVHTCQWSDWVADEGKDTHTRICKDSECGKTETENHGWDRGAVTAEPGCTEHGVKAYTCADCGAAKTEQIDALGHDWSDWRYDSVDSHIRSCGRNCGVADEFGGHEWSEWAGADEQVHTMTCDICSGTREEAHEWDGGAVTKEPTEVAEGERTYTCTICAHTKKESIDKLEHEHKWSDWAPDNNGSTHSQFCRCNETNTEDHDFGSGEVTQAPSHIAVGEITYTCGVCNYIKTDEIPMIEDHEWTEWLPDDNHETHSRSCICAETESEPHIWTEWAQQRENVYQRKCTVCNVAELLDLNDSEQINTTPDTNAVSANMANTSLELVETILTKTEQSQLAAGTAVSVYLSVEDISETVTTEEKTAVAAAAGEAQIGMYLDIDLFKVIGNTETQVTETNGMLTITFVIPDELISTDHTANRVYRIVRVHEDEDGNTVTDVIEGTFDPDEKTFTFQTDKFSTYALIYSDESAVLLGDVNDDGSVTILDLMRLANHFAKNAEINKTNADVNADGKVTILDLMRLANFFAGKAQLG